jgi:D-cysteine desulfhydrase
MPPVVPDRIPLAILPTPLVRLSRLERELGQSCSIWLKRDDLSGLELTGNKVRKLEFILADALACGCDTLVTEGVPQSNHCRATAAACARVGLRSVLLLRPAPSGVPQGNHLLDVLYGAEVRAFPREAFDADRQRLVAGVLDELRAAGRRPRWTPMGASEPLGCWGYVGMMSELAAQLRDAGIRAADVVVSHSSGGTYCGMLLGRVAHACTQYDVWGVPVSDTLEHHRRLVADLCRDAADRLRLPPVSEADVRLIDGYVGPGYAQSFPAALDGLRLLARCEAILLDPVYTAKGFCAMLDGVRTGRFGGERPVVFVHTGGIFSNFARADLLTGAAHE